MYFTESVCRSLNLLAAELEASGQPISAEDLERLGVALTRLDQQVDAYEKEQLVRELGWLRVPDTSDAATKLGAI